jgi:hypothetical protein
MRIDHVIYGAADLDVAAARVEADLGLTAVGGGRHDGVGTHNRVVPLTDGSYLELLAVADPDEAARSALGAALQAGIARGDGLLGWAVAVPDVRSVAARLGTSVSTVGRQGMTARLTGVAESLAEPCLPFFIERGAARFAAGRAPEAAGIGWIELAGDAGRLERWLDGAPLPLRVVAGEPGVRAIGVGDRELRTR